MKKIPTDLELLNAIYDRYYDQFVKYSKEEKVRVSKIYVPIDCAEIARDLGVDRDIVFGRLYYHLENKYGYTQDDDSKVHFFAFEVGEDRHCVNFPYVASVLANLRLERRRFNITTCIAILALIIALLSLGVSLMNQGKNPVEPAFLPAQPVADKNAAPL